MKLSDRIETLTGGGSDGWDLYRKSQELKAQGIAVTVTDGRLHAALETFADFYAHLTREAA